MLLLIYPHLSLHLKLLQLPLVGPLAECFVDLGHDRDLFAAIINDHLAFRLSEVSQEPQHCDPHRQCSLDDRPGQVYYKRKLTASTEGF